MNQLILLFTILQDWMSSHIDQHLVRLDEVLGHDVPADRADSIGRRIRGALEVLLPLGDVSGLDGLNRCLSSTKDEGMAAEKKVSGRRRSGLVLLDTAHVLGIHGHGSELVGLIVETTGVVVPGPLGRRVGTGGVRVPSVPPLPDKVSRVGVGQGGGVSLRQGACCDSGRIRRSMHLIVETTGIVVPGHLACRVGSRSVRIPGVATLPSKVSWRLRQGGGVGTGGGTGGSSGGIR
mmetsp:Transcript_9069/g.30216  ORF Transcript_9069/g.30216 Transcript_9069/m.30216 type:complete len:235 (+) Transcript_9069:57-761(+)